MEFNESWLILAGALVAALIVYALIWRLVDGTHTVIRVLTRIGLGALIVVPAILFFMHGHQGAMRENASAPAPVGSGQSADIAKPRKKAAVPPSGGETETATAEETKDVREILKDLETREAENRRETSEQPSEEEIAEIVAIEPGAGGAEEAAPIEEEAATEGRVRKKTTSRRYRRSHSYKPSAGANGGGGASGAGEGGVDLGTTGSSGSTITLDDFELEQPSQPPTTASAPESSEIDIDSVINLGVPDRDSEVSGSEPPGESGGWAAPGASAPPTTTAAEEVAEDWSVVPVYYGTDRARADKEKRIGYDWQRGRRLELGRALVTIPKEHVVPMVERPWAIKIPYVDIVLYEAAEDPKKHFTMKELKSLSRAEFLDIVKQRLAKSARFKDHGLVFIHGYKTKFDNAVYRTAQIAYDLKFDGAPFLYSWPSGGTLQGYTYDRESAGQAELHLRNFLEMLRDETGVKKLSIIAHSMGNQLLLRTLQDMKRSMPEGVQISQLILAAPDVDRDNFQNIVNSIQGIADGITLYAAANDTALSFSRRVNGGVPRAGDVPEGGPIVMEGIDTIDATATSMDSVGINHSGYAENNALLEDIGRLVSAGIRPPGVRLPKLESVETDKGTYWRYPSSQ